MNILLLTQNHSREWSVPTGSTAGSGRLISTQYHRPIDIDGRTCRKTVTVGWVDQRTHVQVKRGYFRLRTSVLHIWYKYQVKLDAPHSAPNTYIVIFLQLFSLIGSFHLIQLVVFDTADFLIIPLIFHSSSSIAIDLPIIQSISNNTLDLPIQQLVFRWYSWSSNNTVDVPL